MSESANPDLEHRRARAMKSGINVVAGCVLLFVALIGLYWLATNAHQRIDLTRNKIYTLSDSTRGIIRDLDDRVTITIYATENGTPPDWNERRQQLRELLVQYRTESGGKVQFNFVDVIPDSGSSAEKAARDAGMEASLMQQASATELKLNKGYFGLQAEYRGESETIPFLIGPLEYQLTRVINKVAAVSTPEIGLMVPAGNPLMGQASQYSILQSELEHEGFEVTTLDPSSLSEDLSRFQMLMLVDPGDLSEDALFNIDQYVMNGGKLFVAAPGVQLDNRMGMNSVVPTAPNINNILEHYGLRINSNIVEDWKGGRTQATLTRASTLVQYRDPFVFQTSHRNEDSPLTDNIPVLMFAYTSTVNNSDRGTSGVVTRLISSSENSRVQEGPFTLEPTELTPPSREERLESQSLAMMVSGNLSSRYATEPPPVLTNDDGTTFSPSPDNIRQLSSESAQVVVVGSALLLLDQVLQSVPANLLLPLNVAEAFTRGGGALELRAREMSFSQLREISPAEATWTQVIILGGIPFLLICAGLAKMLLNRRRKNRYRITYGSAEK